jgi:hypothetical protein
MATVYYDFSLATNGAGTSKDPRNAWANPGNDDVIRIKRGNTWARASQLNLAAFTGLTFGAWANADGSDDTSLPMPIITHTAASTFIWNFQGAGTHKIYDLDFRDCSSNANGAVIGSGLVAATSVNASIEVHRCNFSNINVHAIRFSGTGAAAAPRCVVRYCTFDNIGEDAIYGGALHYEVGYCRMTRLSMNSANGDGVGFLDAVPTLAWVHHNYIDHSDVDAKHCIIIDSGTAHSGYAVIEHNELIGFGDSSTEAGSHTMINGDARMIVRYNDIRSAGIAINLAGNNSRAYSNIIRPANARTASPGIINIQAADCLLTLNNIIASATLPAHARGVDIGVGITGTRVQGNIFVGIPTAVRSGGTSANPTATNNVFHMVDTQYASGGDAIVSSDDVTGDPQLGPDYSIPATSPCKGAGVYIPGAKHFGGHSMSVVSPDIGTRRYFADRAGDANR